MATVKRKGAYTVVDRINPGNVVAPGNLGKIAVDDLGLGSDDLHLVDQLFTKYQKPHFQAKALHARAH